ncbi:MAG: hypothetical protein IPJ76_01830 [Flavobacteriales bacterium]|nr:MAG: hypothetical protein IPJ76_01830 [Flavobacteriales bacterium]
MKAWITYLNAIALLLSVVARAQAPTLFYAQEQTRDSVRLDFSPGPVVVDSTNFTAGIHAGSHLLCDPATGDILFASTISGILDANGTTLLNGNTVNGGFVIPRPSSISTYYVLTWTYDNQTNTFGLVYSEVDLAAEGGTGAVVLPSARPLAEGLGILFFGLSSPDGSAHWIFVSKVNTTELLRFKVSALDGFQEEPDTVQISGVVNLGGANASVSHTNSRVSIIKAVSNDGVLVLDADPFNGTLSNPRSILGSATSLDGASALSSNGEVLYVSSSAYGLPRLWQYDLTQSDEQSVMATELGISGLDSAFVLHTYPFLGSDGRVYMTHDDCAQDAASFMSYLESPNTLGQGCGANWRAIGLGPSYDTPCSYHPTVFWPYMGAVGIAEWSSGSVATLQVFPSPASNVITVSRGSALRGPAHLHVLDEQGRLVHDQSWPNAVQAVPLDVSTWAVGVYHLRALSDEGQMATGRFAVQ